MNAPDFWKDAAAARRLAQEKTHLQKTIDRWNQLGRSLADFEAAIELAQESGDDAFASDLARAESGLERELHHLEIEMMLAGEHDLNNAIVSIHPGAGGTESQDWAQMLFRMYTRWAERTGFKLELIDLQPGEEAGIKDATFSVAGDYAYGYLKAEAGVHRLVRISPFDANKRRHTSFASVFVYPEIEEVEIEIDENAIQMDTFRSSGPGGQNVNKVSTAVRLTHLPSGVVVACQTERSQLKNRQLAMKLLRAKLFEIERQKKDEQLSKVVGEKKDVAWGNQIRSYVFQPYQMVKDHRTGVEVGKVDAVMDGELDGFINAYLLQAVKTSKGL